MALHLSSESMLGCVFFSTTVLHLLHVMVGILLVAGCGISVTSAPSPLTTSSCGCNILALPDPPVLTNTLGLEYCYLCLLYLLSYWHWVELVWLYILDLCYS